jgi:nucleotide-binding universal stress UspA family protein
VWFWQAGLAAPKEDAMKIVLGFDDSPHAQSALQWICQQRWPEATRVVVVSAVRAPLAVYAEVYAPAMPYPADVVEDMTRHSHELAEGAQTSLRDAGLAAESRVLQGDPREVLVDVARAESADLVVVGSHGRTGLAKLVLGSVAAHVVGHAPCSVMVVKRPHG